MGADTAEEAKHKEALNAQLKEYISEWRKTREKEEEELKKLKEKQAKRKEIRAEQEKKLNQQKKEEEEKLRKEEAEKKAKEAEEKKKRLEEAEAKRQEMLDAQKAAGDGGKKAGASSSNDARKEMTKTKEQLEEEKKIALSIRIKPLELGALDSDELKAKANELFNVIVALETDKYDYEQRKLSQELDLKELKERQKAQLRQKALKKGLDPEALVGKYPPMIRMYSKYERRLVHLTLQKARRKVVMTHLQQRKRKNMTKRRKKKKRRRRSKQSSQKCNL